MIKYNYKLERDEGNEKQIYVPQSIPTEIPQLVKIEGPNSTGKSTLLNLIAIGFNGIKRKDINPSLHQKMIALLDNTYQNIEFDIQIKNKTELIRISKQISKNKINFIKTVNGFDTELTPEQVLYEYNLIYDIPENPTERLNLLTLEVKNNQKHSRLRVEQFSGYIRDEISKAKKAKDDKKIYDKKSEIKIIEDNLGSITQRQLSMVETVTILKKYHYLKMMKSKRLDLDSAEKMQKRELATANKVKKKKFHIEYVANNRLNSIMQRLDKDYENARNLIMSIKQIPEIVVETFDFIDIQQIERNLFVPKAYLIKLESAKNELEKFNSKQISDKDVEKSNTLSQIIKLLENYDDKNDNLPGVETKIGDFIEILKSENQKYLEDVIIKNNALLLCEIIESMDDDLRGLENTILPNYKMSIQSSESENDFDESVQYSITSIKEKIEKLKNEEQVYRKKCVEMGIDPESDVEIEEIYSTFNNMDNVDEFRGLSPTKLGECIEKYDLNISDFDKRKAQYKVNLVELGNELRELEEATPHKYKDRIEDLLKIHTMCKEITDELHMYDKYVDKITIGNEFDKVSEKELKYEENIGKFLGTKIGTIRHIDKVYVVDSISLRRKEILTVDEKLIRYADMGTGQSQSAYLLGKLNSLDKRKAIVLIDEIAMMDSHSLIPIYKRINEINNKGALIAAIVVQKSEEVSIINLGDE